MIFRGGGVSPLKNQRGARISSQHLGLDNKKPNSLTAKDYPQTVISDLEVTAKSFDDSNIFQNHLLEEKTSKDISTIYSEIKKEDEVQTIDKSSGVKVLEVKRKLKSNDYSHFKSALSKLKKFGANNVIATFRSRGHAFTPKIQKLSEIEKKAIYDFFDKFKDLKKDQVKFSTELSKVSEGIQKQYLTHNTCLSCIPGNLRTIGWYNQELNVFHKKTKYRRSPINQYQYYSDDLPIEKEQAQKTWGQWEGSNHPYRYLFDTEKDWIESVEAISNVWKAYYSTMNRGGRRFCAVTSLLVPLGNLCSANKSTLEKKIDEAKASLELRIGSKLMNIMNQLGN